MTSEQRCRSRSEFGHCGRFSKHDGPHQVLVGGDDAEQGPIIGFRYGKGAEPGWVWQYDPDRLQCGDFYGLAPASMREDGTP